MANDLDELFDLRRHEDVARYLLTGPFDRDEARAQLESSMVLEPLAAEGDAFDLAVVRRDTGALIGSLVLMLRDVEGWQTEIGYALHPDHHGQGFAREAVGRLLAMAFEDFGFHRAFGRCNALNTASSRLMADLGMRQEAHHVRSKLVKGEWADELVFALLRDEWPVPAPTVPA